MALPFFYIPDYSLSSKQVELDEATSAHVIQVLRMKQGDQINLTDGKGNLLTCTIESPHRKKITVIVDKVLSSVPASAKSIIAISLIKTTARFEWFLEKATEIGLNEIIPLICKRTEREKFRYDRMQSICISAMLQSQQVWLPVLHEPQQFTDLYKWKCENGSNFIAHCQEGDKAFFQESVISTGSLICIGPEGDFTEDEISLALKEKFIPVSLGKNRLRTETAGIVAAIIQTQSTDHSIQTTNLL